MNEIEGVRRQEDAQLEYMLMRHGIHTSMRSKIEPDRYADTGFSVKDTPPEINRRMFEGVMALSEGERLKMGVRCSTWRGNSCSRACPAAAARTSGARPLYERMYGEPCPIFADRPESPPGD